MAHVHTSNGEVVGSSLVAVILCKNHNFTNSILKLNTKFLVKNKGLVAFWRGVFTGRVARGLQFAEPTVLPVDPS